MGSVSVDTISTKTEAQYGRRLLPNILDERAASGYPRPYAYIARSPDPNDGFITISYEIFAQAVNRLAYWLDDHLAGIVGQGQTFAYFGPFDLRYTALVIATMKTRRKLLLPSLRNTVEAQHMLFQRSECKAVLHDAGVAEPVGKMLRSMSSISAVTAPSLDEVLLDEAVPHYDFPFTVDDVGDEEILVLHSSGSSGSPKPVHFTHQWLCRNDNQNVLSSDEGLCIQKDILAGQNLYSLLPTFHAGGLSLSWSPLTFETSIVVGHPSVVPTASYMTAVLAQGIVTTFLAPPSLLQDMSEFPDGLDEMRKLDHVAYCGGPLPPPVGNKLSQEVKHIYSMLGMTEYGWYSQISNPNNRWAQMKFHSDAGYRFEEVTGGMFELVIPHHTKYDKFHGTALTYPDLPEYRTKDLYSKESDGWWAYQGRVDDLIVLSNGEKINPIPQEDIIRSHPLVKAVLVVGEHQFLPSLLVEAHEPPTTESEQQTFREKLWPLVMKANENAPRYARTPKSLIVFLPPGKSFLRAGKGTVQRWLTVRSFKEQLDHAYMAAERGLISGGVRLDNPHDAASIKALTTSLYSGLLGVETIGSHDDVFERGLDSLQVSILVQQLRATLRESNVSTDLDKINSTFLYAHPTIDSVSTALSSIIKGEDSHEGGQLNGIDKSREEVIQGLIDKYSAGLPQIDKSKYTNLESGIEIILTGATGSLGGCVLSALLSQPTTSISKIYCLNRHSSTNQAKLNTLRGLEPKANDARKQRVEFLTVDLSRPDLSLSLAKYTELQSSPSIILHCAWSVNFNQSLSSFERTHIAGVRHLLDLGSPMMFFSSISTVMNHRQEGTSNTIPEEIITDLSAPESIGYAESKYVAERVLGNVPSQRTASLSHKVLRIGQIAGPVLPPLSGTGIWNTKEWFPSLILSSKYLGLLPDSLGMMSNIDFVPVDITANIIVDLLNLETSHLTTTTTTTTSSSSSESQGTEVYNILNPKSLPFSTLLPTIKSLLSSHSKEIKTVPLSTWTQTLSFSNTTETTTMMSQRSLVEDNPALKLLEWYKSLASAQAETSSSSQGSAGAGVGGFNWSTTKTQRDSITARELTRVSEEWVRIWVRQWAI